MSGGPGLVADEGYVSIDPARRDYAVVLDPAGGSVDLAATERLRATTAT